MLTLVEPKQDGRIFIEKINAPFLFGDKATAAEHHAGIAYAIERGWLSMHESGTYVPIEQAGSDLFTSLPMFTTPLVRFNRLPIGDRY